MTTTPAAAIGGDELAKALRDAYGQGCRHAVGVAPESATAYREKRDAWIRQYMARLAPAAGAGVDPLTAAAPDMLASLRALLPHAKGQSFAFRALAIEAAEAAIAKAEGR